jgi:adenylate cyclase class IV
MRIIYLFTFLERVLKTSKLNVGTAQPVGIEEGATKKLVSMIQPHTNMTCHPTFLPITTMKKKKKYVSNDMKVEIEIKLAIAEPLVKDVIDRIEKEFNCKKTDPFHQITHQFFLDDYTKQTAFPRVRNEENGNITFTVKARLKESSEFFKRTELETVINDAEKVIDMMPLLGFPKKISWEKKRHSFLMDDNADVCFFLDETPMGWFLEIEAEENKIEEAIAKLELQEAKRINRAYLGLWEEYKKEHNISCEDMMF